MSSSSAQQRGGYSMGAVCRSYNNTNKVLVDAFSCPKAELSADAVYCCGFSDSKYCCDDPNSFFPYEYAYMWRLSVGALIGLSVAVVVLLAFVITLCVLCYLFMATKPQGLNSGLHLRTPDSRLQVSGLQDSITHVSRPQQASRPQEPGRLQVLYRHFAGGRLDCENPPPEPERLFQRCFMATVPSVRMERPAQLCA